MKLKNFSFSSSHQAILMVCFLTSAIVMTVGGFSYRSGESAIQSLQSLRNGITICSNRVGQSHYALLGGVSSAKAMTSNYFSSTDECFFQFDRKIDELNLIDFEGYSNDVYDEFINYKNMAKNFSLGNIPLARIVNSFNRLEELRFDISGAFAKEIRSLQNSLKKFRYSIIFAIALLGTSIVAYLLTWSQRRKSMREIERMAYSFNGEYESNPTEVERLLEQVFDRLRLPAVKNLFLEYNTFILEKAYPANRTLEYSKSEKSDTFEFDDEYINSIFDNQSSQIQEKKSDVIELSAENLELTEEELEDQWVSSSSLNNESSYEFTLADEFDELIDQDQKQNEIATDHSNFELKQISVKVKEALGETIDTTRLDSSNVNYDNPIGQKISEMISAEPQDEAMSIVADKEVSFQKLVSQTAKTFMKRSKNSNLKWEFASSYQDFQISVDKESIEQVLYSIMSRLEKGFNELEISSTSRLIKVNTLAADSKVQFRIKGLLFNTAELEYLNHGEQSVRKLIDLNLVTGQELLTELGGKLMVRNELNDNNIKEGIVEIQMIGNTVSDGASSDGPILKRIVTGTKAKLLKSLGRETTI